MKTLLRIAVPVALAALVAPAAAQSNRCVDKDGKTVYMERPCATYGYRTEKQLKDPPRGDGTGSVLRSGQAVAGPSSHSAEGGGARQEIQVYCDGRQILCRRGDTIVCGSQRQACAGD